MAEQVSVDAGALELHKVFELIAEGENIPVHFDKELKVTNKKEDRHLKLKCLLLLIFISTYYGFCACSY